MHQGLTDNVEYGTYNAPDDGADYDGPDEGAFGNSNDYGADDGAD